jgi:hypothetical protein
LFVKESLWRPGAPTLDDVLRLAIVISALVAFSGTASAQAPPPNIYTGAATPSDTSARVAGYFVGGPEGIPETCWFEYGTTGFDSRVDTVCSGTTYAVLGPLSPGTLYYYRAAASNTYGTTWAATKSFTTLGSPPPGPPPPPAAQPPTAEIAALRNQTPRSVARRGVRLRITLVGSCPCALDATVRLRGKPAGTRRRSNAQGTVEFTVRLRARVRRQLRRARRATLVVRLTVTDTGGRSRVRKETVRLRRA